MKKIYALITMLSLCAAAYAINYPGNNKTSFGGAVGEGTLDVISDGVNVTFTLNRGTGNFNDMLVIYIDSKRGGFPTTKRFIDIENELLRAVSGYNGTNRATFNFNTDFRPDYALAFGPAREAFTGGAVLVELQKDAPFTVISSPELTNATVNDATTYTVSIPLSEIGVSAPVQFNFIGTYISSTGYRSDEAFGGPMTNFSAGWNEYTSTSSPLAFNKALPVIFGNFNGVVKGQAANLSWSTKTEINCKQFELQKSNNGTSWQTVATVAAKNSSTGAQYSATDNNVIDVKSYYRIKLVNLDGSASYSSIIILRKNGTITAIDLLGNPVKNVINLNISHEAASVYQLELYTIDGRKILSQSYTHPGGSGRVSINLPANVKGNCVLSVSNGTDKQTLKILVD